MTTARVVSSLILACCASCASAWDRYDESVYQAAKHPGPEADRAHCELLEEIIRTQEERNQKPPPGICVEYACYLARLSRAAEALAYLDKEVEHYPESRTFTNVVRRMLNGEDALPASGDDR